MRPKYLIIGWILTVGLIIGFLYSQSREHPPKITGNYVLNLINQERFKAGKEPLKHDTRLDYSSYLKASDMVEDNYFAHEHDGKSVEDWVKDYAQSGENLGKCQKEPEEVVADWMASPAHRALMLSDFKYFGSAQRVNPVDHCAYWVSHYGK